MATLTVGLNTSSTGANSGGRMQDPTISMGAVLLPRGLAARQDPFPTGLAMDLPAIEAESTVWMNTSEALLPPPVHLSKSTRAGVLQLTRCGF